MHRIFCSAYLAKKMTLIWFFSCTVKLRGDKEAGSDMEKEWAKLYILIELVSTVDLNTRRESRFLARRLNFHYWTFSRKIMHRIIFASVSMKIDMCLLFSRYKLVARLLGKITAWRTVKCIYLLGWDHFLTLLLLDFRPFPRQCVSEEPTLIWKTVEVTHDIFYFPFG